MIRRLYHYLTDWPESPEGELPWQAYAAAFMLMGIMMLVASCPPRY